jgi:ribosomal protein L32E
MHDRILHERGKAMEDVYIRDQDARLLKKLRMKAHLDEIAVALGEKLRIDDPALLEKARDLGITLETAPALFLAPLVQVAWTEGKVTRQEHEVVLRLARERGMEVASPAYAQLEEWLRTKPSDAIFDTALEVLKLGFSVFPPAEREERVNSIVAACRQVADASGGPERLLGLGDPVSAAEAASLDHIARSLRTPE